MQKHNKCKNVYNVKIRSLSGRTTISYQRERARMGHDVKIKASGMKSYIIRQIYMQNNFSGNWNVTTSENIFSTKKTCVRPNTECKLCGGLLDLDNWIHRLFRESQGRWGSFPARGCKGGFQGGWGVGDWCGREEGDWAGIIGFAGGATEGLAARKVWLLSPLILLFDFQANRRDGLLPVWVLSF